MPKQITCALVKKYITEFGSDVFSADQNVLFCNFCETKVSVDRRFIVTQHLKTEKHKRALIALKIAQVQVKYLHNNL